MYEFVYVYEIAAHRGTAVAMRQSRKILIIHACISNLNTFRQ